MNNSKKIISLLLSVIMIMSVFTAMPFTAGAADSDELAATGETAGDYEYKLLTDGTAEITEYTGKGGNVTIPSTLGGYSVTSIGESAFMYRKGITGVTIPNSVTSISYEAFYGCTGLTSATIPDSVTSIGGYAFTVCTGLTSITIPDSVTSIGESAFSSCNGLTSVTIGNSVASISNYTFSRCTNLASVAIGNSVTSIGDHAFYECTGLTSVIIPDSVTTIGSSAFSNCTGLTSVTIPNSVTRIGDYAFEVCTGLTSVTIPDSVTRIGEIAFSGCTGLTSVTIGNSVTRIENRAFYGCTGLTSITIPDSVTSIGNSAFYGCTGLTSVTIPDSVTSIDNCAFEDCTNLKSIAIPDSVTSIGLYALGYYYDDNTSSSYKIGGFTIYGYEGSEAEKYANKKGFTFVSQDDTPSDFNYLVSDGTAEITGYTGDGGDLTIPSSIDGYTVTNIGNSAFEGCTGLTSIPIPDSVTSIGSSAFEDCTGLTSVTIPDSVTSIGDYAFGYYCENNTYKKVDGFTIYGYKGSEAEKYANKKGFTFISLDDTPSDFNYLVSDGTAEITGYTGDGGDVIIPSSIDGYTVTSLNYNAFRDCSSITSVTIPDSVTNIGNYAFYGCTGLTSITIPNSVTNIGGYTFYGCTGLKSAAIGNSVTSIGGYSVFSGCTGLTSVTIGNSVTSIGNYAFQNCSGLTSIIIPDSVTSIRNNAFEGCTGLTSVTIPDSVTSIGEGAFSVPTIYGYEGSEAERYANDEWITFVPLNSKSDEETGIILDIPEDVELKVKDITAEISCDLPDGCDKKTAYDISLTKNGETVQPDNIVTVKIPCDNPNAKVYRLEADGSLTDMHAVYKDGYLVFTTDHFSIYVLATLVESAGVTVSGGITSYLSDSDVTVKLTGVDNDFTATVSDKTDYAIENVPDGEYTLSVKKKDHVDREYAVTVNGADVTHDVKLCPIGDANNDGKVNAKDSNAIMRHISKASILTDYNLLCANANGDTKVNAKDVNRILRHISKAEPLF